MDELEERHYFVTPVYMIKKPEFLEVVGKVSQKYIELTRKEERVVNMSPSYMHEPEIAAFSQYVSQTAYNILASQGFKMKDMVTFFTEMWTQEHNHLSSMDTHVHGHGSQISCFYFLETPEESCNIVIHDPRPGKVIANLQVEDDKKICIGSHQIYFKPSPGLMVFLNSWIPHSFTKNFANEPMKFVHINLSVTVNPESLIAEEKTVEIL